MSPQLILIIEDDPTWQEIFTEIVADAGFDSRVATTVNQADTVLSSEKFALAVVDISLSLPDHAHRGGVEVLKIIAQLPERLPAIVVTGYATVDLAIETLADLDAAYFFRKEEFNRRKFIEVVRQETSIRSATDVLSDREREVLVLMSRGKTNKQIAEKLVVSVNTVKKHAQNIFTKLNVDSRAAAVAKALQQSN